MSSIDPRVDIGHVHLKVADIERALDVLRPACSGSRSRRATGIRPSSSPPAGTTITSASTRGSRRAERRLLPATPGCFHAAIRYPDRKALADALRRLVDAGIPLDGASDHGVSEALYLRDPDGNGLELYRDRPREEWPRNDDGSLGMFTRPLDVQALLPEAD